MRVAIVIAALWAALPAFAQDTDASGQAEEASDTDVPTTEDVADTDAAADPDKDGAVPPPPPPPPPKDLPNLFGDDAAEEPPAAEAPAAPEGTGLVIDSPDKDRPKRKDKAELTWQLGGMVQYDLRIRPIQYRYGTYYQDIPDPPTLARNELLGKVKGRVKYGKFGAVGDVDLVLRAYPQSDTINALSSYNANTPFRVEAHDLYVFAQDLFPGFDLRIGQQKAMFGVGDQFNPTNTINANDYEDVLLFGDQQGNLMVRMDYSPRWNISLTGILVPVFKPALLPRTAYLGQNVERFPNITDETRWTFATEKALGAGEFEGVPLTTIYPTIVGDVAVQQPEFSAENMQGFFRVGGLFGPIDLALSYYRGFSDLPQPIATETTQTRQQLCEFDEDLGVPSEDRRGECVDGVLNNDVTLGFPRMHVLGLNLAGEAKLGYRFEFAMIFPEQVRNRVTNRDVRFDAGPLGEIVVDGEHPTTASGDDLVVDGRPFAKWVLGLDYTFGKHVMLNAMWIHGFPNEFGAGDWIQEGYSTRASGLIDSPNFSDCVQLTFDDQGNLGREIDGTRCIEETRRPKLGDYVVLGLDINFASQRGLLRLFTIWDMTGVYFDTWDADAGERTRTYRHAFTKEGFSAVLYPDFRWDFGRGFELHAGALVQLGQSYSMFGTAENGGHLIWTRARYSF